MMANSKCRASANTTLGPSHNVCSLVRTENGTNRIKLICITIIMYCCISYYIHHVHCNQLDDIINHVVSIRSRFYNELLIPQINMLCINFTVT